METLVITFNYRHNVEVSNKVLREIANLAKSDNYKLFNEDGWEIMSQIDECLMSLVDASKIKSFGIDERTQVRITNKTKIIEMALDQFDSDWKMNLAELRGE